MGATARRTEKAVGAANAASTPSRARSKRALPIRSSPVSTDPSLRAKLSTLKTPVKRAAPAPARTQPKKPPGAPPFARSPVLQELEPRLLMSADLNPLSGDALLASPALAGAEFRSVSDHGAPTVVTSAAVAPIQRTNELVFVDTATPDYQTLIDEMRQSALGDGRYLEFVLIDAERDGIRKITDTLAKKSGLDAIHIVSHATDGSVQLGSSNLDFESLIKRATSIKKWGAALTENGDILFYGCDLAATEKGQSLLEAMSRLTGADVAASEDLTGAAAKGGDWDLEFKSGAIEAEVAVGQSAQAAYEGVLEAVAQGGETRANTTTSGTQETHLDVQPRTVAIDRAGNFVVVWAGNGSGDGAGIFAQRYDAAGVAQGGEFRVNTTTADTQRSPAVAMDGAGNFIVAWTSNNQDGSGEGVYAQRYNAAGVAQGGEFRVNSFTSGAQRNPLIAMNESGVFVIAWDSTGQDGGGEGVYAQRYNAAGVAQGGEFRVNATTAGDQWADSTAMDANGNFIVAFSSSDGAGLGTYTRRYDAAGTALTGEVQVNTTTAGDQTWDSVAMNASGAYVIAWMDAGADGSGEGIYAQRFDASGVAQGAEFRVNTSTAGDQNQPTVAIDAGGNFVITWSSNGTDGSGWGVYRQDYNADGTPFGGETRVNATTSGDQRHIGVAMNAAGQYVATWDGNGPGDATGVFFQRYTSGLVVDTVSDAIDGTTTSISALLGARGADGRISLREAITAANLTANVGGNDRIYFGIPGAGPVFTINVGSHATASTLALPNITDAVTIDATTQTGYAGSPVVELNGTAVTSGGTARDGLRVTAAGASDSVLRGFVINRFASDGIELQNADRVTIAGNWIGVSNTGGAGSANGDQGINVNTGSINNTIGGTSARDRNVISGNTDNGILLASTSGNTIVGNYIGLNAAGTAAIGNGSGAHTTGGNGIRLNSSSGNTIGGSSAAARNVIGGNDEDGIYLTGSTSNTIRGNYLGVNAAGTGAIGNNFSGVSVDNSSNNNTIGGTGASDGNVISGNSEWGIWSNFSDGNTIQGNRIGTNAAGTGAIANGFEGILLYGSDGNTVGGAAAGAGNLISGNTGLGLHIDSSSGNVVFGNYVGVNASGNVDLGNGAGISIQNASNNTVGGTTAAERNVVSGNAGLGIALDNSGTTGNVVSGNYIGVGADGTTAIGNDNNGIRVVNGAANNTIGGTAAGAGNLISNNQWGGIYLIDLGTAGAGNRMLGNVSFTNPGDQGITLQGFAGNDGTRTAGEANLYMDTPVFTSASLAGTLLTVSGRIGTTAGDVDFANSRVEIFKSNASGDGIVYLGFLNTGANGDFSGTIDVTGLGLVGGNTITGTATDSGGNTSEYGANFAATSGATISGTVYHDVDGDADVAEGGTLTFAGATVRLYADNATVGTITAGDTVVATTTTDASGNYSFTVANGNYWIAVDSSTLNSGAAYNGGYDSSWIWGEQTWGDDSTTGALDVAARYGGRGATVNDAQIAGNATGSEHVARVNVSGASVAGVNYGFSFNAIVNTTDDPAGVAGNRTVQGSLRQFLINANAITNASYGMQSAEFQIGAVGSAQSIGLNAAELPTITDAIRLDAWTQGLPGYNGAPLIELNGLALGAGADGLTIQATNGASLLRGFVINRFTDSGILVNGATGVTIQGNYIGTNAAGNAASSNNRNGGGVVNGDGDGIQLLNANGNTIGGLGTGERNVLSGNDSGAANGWEHGVYLWDSDNNVIEGNYIGTNAAGTAAIRNFADGIGMDGSAGGGYSNGNIIRNNLISGNKEYGIWAGPNSGGQIIQGNYIGTNAAGTAAVANANGGIRLDSSSNSVGGALAAERNVISGNSGYGIDINGGSNNEVRGNFVGLDANGDLALGNDVEGISITNGATGNTIGGTAPGSGNVISGNGVVAGDAGISVWLGANNNVILGNYIGTDATGLLARANGGAGINIDGVSGTLIGGSALGAGNVVSGNDADGILLSNGATGTVIHGNYIGVDAGGTLDLGNTGAGILIDGGDSNTIGGAAAAARNIIAGNNADGMSLWNSADFNVIRGNWIGQGIGGIAVGNSDDGIEITGGSNDNWIGGTGAGDGNVIRGSTDEGIEFLTNGDDRNRILGNSIFGNAQLGINLNGSTGVDANDPGDADTIANQGQNYPVIGTVTNNGSSLRVQGTLGTTPAVATYRVEFFVSAGNNEGRTYLGFRDVTTDGAGNGSFDETFAITPVVGERVTATATDSAGNTSEFSAGVLVPVVTSFAISGTVYNDVDGDAVVAEGGEGTFRNVTVRLYQDDGDGVIEATDGFVTSTTTNASGAYTFTGLAGGTTYWVTVDSRTIGDALDVAYLGGFNANNVWAEQTYGDNIATGGLDLGARYGGRNAGTSDNAAAGLTSAEHVARVQVAAASVTGVNSGFSYGAIVNTRGDTADDDGGGTARLHQGSLRQFLLNSNAIAGVQTSNFSIGGGGAQTITPSGAALALITDAVNLDATTQEGFAGTPLIELNGASTPGPDAITVIGAGSSGSTVRGFVINRFAGAAAVRLVSSSDNVVAGNYIGTNAAGTAASANVVGVFIQDGTDNRVGGTTAADRNVISGNSVDGIQILGAGSTGNVVQGNYIGLDVTGTVDVGNNNQGIGIFNAAQDNTIGGTAAGAGNVISGNNGSGVRITQAFTSGNVVQGNYIGTDVTGTLDRGNSGDGVQIGIGATGNTIGGSAAGAGNVISGNNSEGIRITDAATANNVVQGNLIGRDATDTAGLGNTNDGINIQNGSDGNTIGGTNPGEGNVISANENGVQITGASTGNRILGNSIYGNTSTGIDLANDGVNPPNGTTNAGVPNIDMDTVGAMTAALGGTTLTLSGYVGNMPASGTFAGARVEFFVSDLDPTGWGEGRTYLGFLTANGSSQFSGNLTVAGVNIGDRITATATDAAGNTSEFSQNVTVTAAVGISGTLYDDVDGDADVAEGGTLAFANATVRLFSSGGALLATTTSDAAGAYSFTGLANGSYYVAVDSKTLAAPAYSGGFGIGDVWADQTYGDDSTTGAIDLAARYGGRNAGTSDNAAALATAEHVAQVVLSGASVNGVNYGFSFSAVVNNRGDTTDDDGANARLQQGSLRQFILNSNAIAGTQTSNFSIGSGLVSIAPTAALPTITDTIVLDGTTQEGFIAAPIVELRGDSAGAGASGFDITAGNSIVRGFVINRFESAGIRIAGTSASGAVVEGNYIGTDTTGLLDLGNTDDGVKILDASNVRVGGSTTAQRNVISGQGGYGVQIDGSDGTMSASNRVQGNYIGLGADGVTDLGNASGGVLVERAAAGNLVGGTAAGEGNVISGNTGDGVQLSALTAGARVEGNIVGLDAGGTLVRGNSGNGVYVETSSDVTIGGTAAGARNVIAASGANGVNVIYFNTDVTVAGNYIGTDVTGMLARGNANAGVLIYWDSNGNTVGGTTAAARNVIVDNSYGVYIDVQSDGNVVSGNYIGIAADGVTAIGNHGAGVIVDQSSGGSTNNVIGGLTAGERNVISGNDAMGVMIRGAGSTGNRLLGNYIGTDASGTLARGNGQWGVYVINAPGNTVGGTAAGAGNVISANGVSGGSGIELGGGATIGTVVQGNFIGTGAGGAGSIGNRSGISITGGSWNNQIGGTAAGAGNVIANSYSGDGIATGGGTGNIFSGNRIYANAGLGIDLEDDGLTPNDVGDADGGDNRRQNFPVLATANVTGPNITITGTLDSAVGGSFRLEFFASSAADPSGQGEGERYLGALAVTDGGMNDADGIANGTIVFSTTLAPAQAVLGGEFVSATAIALATGDTSEFSANHVANTVPVNTVPASVTATEDVIFAFNGANLISVTDVEGNLASVSLAVLNGQISVSLAGGGTVTAGAIGTGAFTITGTQLQLNAALSTLLYRGNTNYNGADTLTIVSTDAGGMTDTDAVSITVNPVNDAPTASAPASYNATEQTPLNLAGTLSVGDVDAAAGSVTVTVSVLSGQINAGAGATGAIVAGSTTATVTITGTLAQVANVLAGNAGATIAYFNGSDTPPATDTLTLSVNDGGNTGAGGAQIASANSTINLAAVNDAPSATAPATYAATEQVSLSLASASLTVSDVDSLGAVETVTLSVVSGTLNATAGATLVGIAGGGTNTLTLTGTIAQLNNLLTGGGGSTLTYLVNSDTPPASDTLTIAIDDGGNSGAGGPLTASANSTINITALNDAPVNAVPGSITVTEDLASALTGISIADADELGGNLLVTLSVPSGTLAAVTGGGVTVGGSGTGSLTLTGTVTDINAFIAASSVSFTTVLNATAAVTLTVTTNDQGNTPAPAQTDVDAVTLNVTAVNDAPAGTDATVATAEDTAYTFALADFGFSDPNDAPANAFLAVRIASLPLAGTLTNNGSALNAGDFVSAADIALGRLVFTPVANASGAGYASFTFQVQDNGGTAPGVDLDASPNTITINVTAVNDAPTASAPASYNATEQASLDLANTGLTVGDLDAGASPVTVTVSVVFGTLSATAGGTGVGIVGSGSATLTLTGTVAQINNLLLGAGGSTLAYVIASDTPPATDTLTLSINDGGNTGAGGALNASANSTINITALNDAPVNAVPVSITVTEDAPSALTGISIADVDAGAGNILVTLSVPAGTLAAVTGGGVTVGGSGSGTLTLTGTVANINAFIAASSVTFTTALNDTSAVTLTVTTDDQGNTPAPALNDVDLVTLNVTAVNDAPVNTVPAAQATNEDTVLVFSAGNGNQVLVADLDAGASLIDVTLTVTNGTLTLAGTAGLAFQAGADGTATMTVRGTVADLNAAMNGMTYSPTANYTGPASLTIVTDDRGFTGAGGALNDSDVVNITVNAVNDAPAGTSATVSTAEDTAYTFTVADFGFSDPNDAPANAFLAVRIASLPLVGTLTNNGSALNVGDFVSATDIALGRLVFTSAANASGAGYGSFTFQVQDNGGTAPGVDLDPTPNTITIDVTAVNDAPTASAPAAYNATEQTLLDLAGTLSVSDVDAAAGSVTVTVSVVSGQINAGAGTTGALVAGSTTTTVTITGTLAQVANVLAGNAGATIAYFNGSDTPPAADALTLSINDGGNTGAGGALNASANSTINITALNDAPVNTVPVSISVTEDVASALTGISIADVDAGAGSILVTLSVPAGTLAAVTGAGVTVGGSGSGTLTLTGTVANINAFIAASSVTFTTALNATAAVTLTVTTDDQGNTPAPALNDSDTVTLNVTAVNDAPVNTVPGSITVTEDLASALTGISIADVDAGAGNVLVTLSVPSGTLAAVTAGGVAVGGSGSGTLTLTGTVTDINAFIAASSVSFTTALNATAAVTLTVTTDDQGNTPAPALNDSDTVTLNVTAVNDAPAGANATVTLAEDGLHVFTAADFGFADAADVPANAFLAIRIASLPLLGTLTNNAASLNVGDFVSVADITAGLFCYTPPANASGVGYASFTFQVQDNGGTAPGVDLDPTPNTITFDVTAVNDAPTASAPASYNATEQVGLDLANTGLSVGDIDAGGAGVTVTLGVVSGTLTATTGGTGVGIVGSGSATLTLTGTVAQINNLLLGAGGSTLAYVIASDTPPATDTLTLSINDGGNTGAGGALNASANSTINITALNDAPVNAVPVSITVTEDAPSALTGISIADVDAGAGNILVTLSVPAGTLAAVTGGGVTVGGSGSGTLTLTGTVANINAFIAASSVTFTTALNDTSAVTLTVTTDDQGNTPAPALNDVDLVTLNVTAVNDAPVNTVPAAQATNEDTVLVFSAGNGNQVLVADLDAGASLIDVTLTVTNGTLTLAGTAGLAFQAGADGTATMTVRGTVADLNAAMNGMTYSPTANYTGPASLTIVTDDRGFTGAGGALNDSDVVNITVNAVNDAPVNTVPVSISVTEDVASALTGISIADVDAGAGNVLVTLSVPSGTLAAVTGGGVAVGGSGSGTLTLSGTVANVNAFIAASNVSFTTALDATAAVTLTVTTDDQGNTPAPALNDVDTVTLNVTAINDTPVNTVPAAQVVNEDTPLMFSVAGGNAIAVADPDAATLRVTLAATNGVLTLASLAGLAFSTGDGAADATMTFTGTAAAINAALDGLSFMPDANYNGPATVSLLTEDLGQTGAGGALQDADVVGIAVNPVNDAPVMGARAFAVNDGETVGLGAANLSATDVDDAAASLVFTVSGVTGGRFELVAAPGVAITTFTQAQILAGEVRFVHDGSNAVPAATVHVFDAVTGVGPYALNIAFTPSAGPVVAPPGGGGSGGGTPVIVAEPALPPATKTEPGSAGERIGETFMRAPTNPPADGGDDGSAADVAAPVIAAAPGASQVQKLLAAETIQPVGRAESESVEVKPLSSEVEVEPVRAEMQILPMRGNTFDNPDDEERQTIEVIMSSVKVTGLAFSVGAVWWAVRAAGLVASLLASSPAWRHVDPLPVLGRDDEEEGEWDEEASDEERDRRDDEHRAAWVLEEREAS